MVVWKVLTPETRPIFRAALAADEATWARSRGWALSQAVIALSKAPAGCRVLARAAALGFLAAPPLWLPVGVVLGLAAVLAGHRGHGYHAQAAA